MFRRIPSILSIACLVAALPQVAIYSHDHDGGNHRSSECLACYKLSVGASAVVGETIAVPAAWTAPITAAQPIVAMPPAAPIDDVICPRAPPAC